MNRSIYPDPVYSKCYIGLHLLVQCLQQSSSLHFTKTELVFFDLSS